MGLFDKLFRKKEEEKEEEKNIEPTNEVYDKISRSVSDKGFLNYTLYEKEKDTTTSIIVNPNPIIVKNKKLYEMLIEWYGDESDTFYCESGSHGAPLETIYAGVDLQDLENDDNYFKYVMTELLKKVRVDGYLAMSKKTVQEINDEVARTGNKRIYPCGRYVGSIVKKDGLYTKTFYKDIGEIFHDLPQMVKEREDYRTNKENERQAGIAKARARLESLENGDR